MTGKNAGFSLIELIVTIAIISIITGGITMGVSIVFSKDASKCATMLNDTLYSVRMNSMSKPGKYTMVVKNIGSTNTQYVAEITCEIDGATPTSEIIYLEGDSSANKINSITAKLKSGASSTDLITSASDTLSITFDKSKGCVSTITSNGTTISGDGIIEFHITPKNGNREADVSLVTSTGKHSVGTY